MVRVWVPVSLLLSSLVGFPLGVLLLPSSSSWSLADVLVGSSPGSGVGQPLASVSVRALLR